MIRNILITGHPQVGKTTLVREVVKRLGDWRIAGFYTTEVLDSGKRTGFAVVPRRGPRKLFAGKGWDVPARLRVGTYGIKIAEFEKVALPELERALASDPTADPIDLVVIDEIAKMELLSNRFRDLAVRLLDSPTLVLASVALHGTGIIRRVKGRTDTVVHRITPQNRDAMAGQVVRELRKAAPAGPNAPRR